MRVCECVSVCVLTGEMSRATHPTCVSGLGQWGEEGGGRGEKGKGSHWPNGGLSGLISPSDDVTEGGLVGGKEGVTR